MYTVLAADDEMDLLNVLELYLKKENIQLIKVPDGISALEAMKKNEVHMVLLDIMMPGMDGFTVLQNIRKTSRIPAIMVTARTQDYDKILGLELGADDYVTKPYNPLEVVARIKAQLRRNYDYKEEARTDTPITVGPLCLSMGEGSLKRSGTKINLTSTELKILNLLMSQPGRIFTKCQIFEHVWGDDYLGDDNTVMVHMSNLRNKIEENPKQPKLLKTVKGLGYKIERVDKP